MIWIFLLSPLAILSALIIMAGKSGETDMGSLILFVVWLIYVVIICATSLPVVYTVEKDVPEVKTKTCLPLYYKNRNGEKIRLKMGECVIVNEDNVNLILEEVLYTSNANEIGSPVGTVKRDTTKAGVLYYSKNEVSPFKEAPLSLETENKNTIRIITVIRLERQPLPEYDGIYRRLIYTEPDYPVYNYVDL